MTNAEKMSKQCAYDTLLEMNSRLIKETEGEYCIMDALPHNTSCCKYGNAGECDECIRLWRLEEAK